MELDITPWRDHEGGKLWMPPMRGGSIPGPGFTATWTAVALTAATAKTIAGLTSGTNMPVNVVEIGISGDATSGNLLVELVYGDGATAGTSTAFTPLRVRGGTATPGATAAINYTAEPTTLTVVKRWRFPWPGGPFVIQSPLGREPSGVVSASTSGKFVGLRLTSSVAVTNCDGYIEFEE